MDVDKGEVRIASGSVAFSSKEIDGEAYGERPFIDKSFM